ncbi:MAG: collagen-like protein, partial [Candidatus Tisiphia sp.]
KGDMGDKGDTGAPGTDGLKGDKGVDGLPGMPGIKGDLGLKGDRGEIGAPGMDGLPGLQGFNGMQGEKGAQGDKGEIGAPGMDGLPGLQGFNGTQGEKGVQGLVGPKGDQGDIGAKGVDGLPGMLGLKGEKGNVGLPGVLGPQGLVGPKGDQGDKGLPGTVGPKGNTGAPGPKGSKGEDGVGAAEADQFLCKMNQTKIEIQNAQKAAEVAKSASEKSAKEAKDFKEEADNFVDKAFRSEQNTQALYSKVKDIFCKTKPTDQVCTARRKKREIKNSDNLPVTSGAGRPTSFISQVINFFYPFVKQDEYKIENKIQELNQVAKVMDAADIAIKFEKVLEETASKCGIPKKSLNFDPVKLQSTILDRSLFNDESRNELLKLLYLSAKKSCPNYKQTDRFLTIFKDRMERTLENNEQQRGFVNIEKTATDNEQPRSFMSDVTSPSSFKAIDLKAVNCLR